MAWSCSSAATVVRACCAGKRKESETTVSAGLQPGIYTPVRDADTITQMHRARETLKEKPTFPHTQRHIDKSLQTLTNCHLSIVFTKDADTHSYALIHTRHPKPETFFPAKFADTKTSPGRIDMNPGKVIHPQGDNIVRPAPISHQQVKNLKSGSDIPDGFGESINVVGCRAAFVSLLWNFKPLLLQ